MQHAHHGQKSHPARFSRGSLFHDIDKMIAKGIEHHQGGKIALAESCYREVLESNPTHPGALHLLGVVMHQTGKSITGIELIERALKQVPDFADAHKNLGYIHSVQGDIDSAIAHYRKSAEHSPTPLESLIELGRLLLEKGENEEALDTYSKAVDLKTGDARAHLGRANALIALERKEEAAEDGARALELAPDDAKLHFDYAALLRKLDRKAEAISLYERAIELRPEMAEAYLNLSNVFREMSEKQKAVDLLCQVIEIKPDYAEAYSNLGSILVDEAMFENALDSYRKAIEIDPKLPEAYVNLGSALQTICRPEQALKAFEISLNLRPGQDAALWNLALSLHAVGRVEDGWDIYGYGFASGQRKPYRPFPDLLWEGENLAGKTIMVWREQGIGDDLHFSTCYHDLIEEAGHVIIECPPRLVDLYARTWPQATVRAETAGCTGKDNYPNVDFDCTAPAGIVASYLRRHLSAFPSSPRPLVADPDKRKAAREWLDTLGPQPKIGLSWRSSIRNPLRQTFATELTDWVELLRRDDVKIINLQYGKEDEDIREASEKLGVEIHHLPGLDTYNDLDGTAALTAELDFVVAPWNAASEMAGALGIPGVIFLPDRHPVQLGSGGMPWHPSLRTHSIMPGFDKAELCSTMTEDAVAALKAQGKL